MSCVFRAGSCAGLRSQSCFFFKQNTAYEMRIRVWSSDVCLPIFLKGRAVFAHLGGGCSGCAVGDGRSRDTTMALTPLGGIPSPTRSGDLDPGALLYLLRHKRLDAQALEDGLYRSAGLAGIAGHGDLRVLLADPRR